MEPITAAAVTSLLVTYAKHLAGVVGDVVDDGLTERLKALWEAVRRRFSGDDQASGALDRVADQPGNDRRHVALEDHLDELMQRDETFAAALADLVEKVRAVGPSNVAVQDAGAVAIGGDVTIRGGRHAAGRDIVIGSPEPSRRQGA